MHELFFHQLQRQRCNDRFVDVFDHRLVHRSYVVCIVTFVAIPVIVIRIRVSVVVSVRLFRVTASDDG